MQKQREYMRERGYLSVAEAAERICKDTAAIYRMLDAGQIDGFRAGRARYVKEASLAKFLEDRQPGAAALFNLHLTGPDDAESGD